MVPLLLPPDSEWKPSSYSVLGPARLSPPHRSDSPGPLPPPWLPCPPPELGAQPWKSKATGMKFASRRLVRVQALMPTMGIPRSYCGLRRGVPFPQGYPRWWQIRSCLETAGEGRGSR